MFSFENALCLIESNRENDHLSIYPNPANSLLYIESLCLKEGETEFEIMDISGRMLSSYNYHLGVRIFSVDISFLPSGVYLITARNSAQLLTSKFVKY